MRKTPENTHVTSIDKMNKRISKLNKGLHAHLLHFSQPPYGEESAFSEFFGIY